MMSGNYTAIDKEKVSRSVLI
ncbi:hypothetical protein QN277_016333 [Acacia crassicarpa]|uniref:Uncharacterized protein n=1 Tax=Acacia crassicarpa TaxID=499986 RepID=A0AAE1TC29_9FABA|nr:hypothetical protein QN277_016333 [Acacia crassicarpa]